MKIDKQFFKKCKKKTTKFFKWFFIDVVLERILYDLDLIRFHPTKKLRVDAVTKASKIGNFKLVLRTKLPLFRRVKLGFKENPQIALILLASAFCPQISLLAIPLFFGSVIYGNTSSGTSTQDVSVSTLEYSHTASTGDDVVAITGVTVSNQGLGNAYNSTVTYGGASMTREVQTAGGASELWSGLFSKGSPATGSQTIHFQNASGTVRQVDSFTISFTGGRTSNVVGATVQRHDASGDPSINITTTVANSILVDCFKVDSGSGSYTPDGGQTQRWYKVWNSERAFSSTRVTTSTGSYTMGWSPAGVLHVVTVVEVLSALVVIPTVTTQAVDQIEKTTARGNGNITDTGGENCTRRGFCYIEGTSGDPTTANSVAYDDGDFGTGAYTKGLTGLTKGTSYRVRAYAVNSAGTGYGTTVQIKTKTDYKIEKSLKYSALPTIAIQKTLKYTVVTTPTALTKSLEYIVNPSPPQEISSEKVVVISDSTTATSPEDIDGLNFNITLKNEGYIMAFMTLTSNTGASNHKKGYFGININGVDSPFIKRFHYAENNGNVEVIFRSGLLQPGQYAVKGRHYTEAGVTLTSKNVTLIAFPTEDEGGNRINSIYDTVASDTVTGSTPEDIDGLSQDVTVDVLSFVLGMITGSVSVNVKDKLYRLFLVINGIIMGVERFLDSVDDIGAIGIICRSQVPETAGQITVKGRHASEAGVTGKIEPVIMVGLALSTKSGGVGYVIPSGAICIQGATLSTTSTVLEDIPTIFTEVTLTQEAHIFAVMTMQMESEKADIENYFAININGIDFEECQRTANVKLDNTVMTVIARTTSKLAAGTYTIKGRWRTTAGNTLRVINDVSIVAVGLETTTQDLPTHLLRSLDYKISSTKSVTKDLEYMVVATPTAKTKELIYKTRGSVKITKGLIYKALSAISITKLLKYCVPSTPSAKTKSLKYNIFLGSTKIEKGLIYDVISQVKIQKSLKYTVVASVSAIQKTLKYTVEITPTAIVKDLKYTVVQAPSAIEKSLKYTVIETPTALTKSLKYCVLSTPSAKQKDLKYTIVTIPTAITKSLKYSVLSVPSAITKSLKYTVLTVPLAIEKILHYEIISEQSVTKSLKYCVITTPVAITKLLEYQVTTTPSAIEKDLYYKVCVEIVITKTMKYELASYPYDKFDSPYIPLPR